MAPYNARSTDNNEQYIYNNMEGLYRNNKSGDVKKQYNITPTYKKIRYKKRKEMKPINCHIQKYPSMSIISYYNSSRAFGILVGAYSFATTAKLSFFFSFFFRTLL